MPSTYPEEIDCVFASSNAAHGNIYISNIEAARNIEKLKANKIRAAITVVKGGFLRHSDSELPNYFYIPAEDTQHFNISQYFQQTFSFIEKNIKKTNVLVHCAAGISRSATIIIAYLMKKLNKRFIEIYRQVKLRRDIIEPNDGFMLQLMDYEHSILNNKCHLSVQKQKGSPARNHQISTSKILVDKSSHFNSVNPHKLHLDKPTTKQILTPAEPFKARSKSKQHRYRGSTIDSKKIGQAIEYRKYLPKKEELKSINLHLNFKESPSTNI